jgi:hypothetical protein
MSRRHRWSIARVSESLGHLFRLRRVLLAAPLVFLPPTASSEEDSMLVVSSAGEVAPAADRAAVRQAAERFVAWETRAMRGDGSTPGRVEVAEGIRLLGDAIAAEGDAVLGSALTQALVAMQWHGAQLSARPENATFRDYEDAGHVHAAFAHAARLLGAMPGAPPEAATALTRAAAAVDVRPLPAQGAEVRAFFRRASTTLTSVAAR